MNTTSASAMEAQRVPEELTHEEQVVRDKLYQSQAAHQQHLRSLLGSVISDLQRGIFPPVIGESVCVARWLHVQLRGCGVRLSPDPTHVGVRTKDCCYDWQVYPTDETMQKAIDACEIKVVNHSDHKNAIHAVAVAAVQKVVNVVNASTLMVLDNAVNRVELSPLLAPHEVKQALLRRLENRFPLYTFLNDGGAWISWRMADQSGPHAALAAVADAKDDTM